MWTISKDKSWDFLKNNFSWVNDMHGVQQSPVHHAEGDVAVHTQMVLRELENLPEFKTLTDQEKEVIWAAALLHDVEKRSTTIFENMDYTSPGHAKKGAMTARQILYREIETPFEIREQVVGLVKYHGLPLWALEKKNPVQYLLKASLEVDTMMLMILAKADMLGRICQDQDEMLYRIDLFKELCIELECWGKPRKFPSNLSKFQYFRKDDQSPDYDPFNDTKSEAIILSGIAGSGKDHYIKNHYPLHEMISLDDLRRKFKIKRGDSKGSGHIIQMARETAKDCLRKGRPFIWNATNITRQMREQLIDMFSVYNPLVKIIYVEVPYKKLITQNKNREHPIPEDAIEHMIDRLEVPKDWEGHEVVNIIN